MSRNPRPTMPCRPPSQPGLCRPGTAESAAGAAAAVANAPRGRGLSKPASKSSIPKRGPPPAPPKKIDYKKPQITKAMAARMKHAQKVQEELERKEREKVMCGPPPRTRPTKRSAIPVNDRRTAGNPCAGRDRRPTSGKGGAAPGRANKCPPPPRPPSSGGCNEPVPEHTINLAKSMNADIVQAEPLQRGLIDNLIIPPGAIDTQKTTIVSIPQPDPDEFATGLPSSTILPSCGNRSVQVICESLDEQDASEAALVNSKLQELQNARRDFVMAVANVGSNAVNLLDESQPEFMDLTPIGEIMSSEFMEPQSPYLMPCCDPDDPYLQPEYGRNHPVVESAREYMRGFRDRCSVNTLYLDDDAPDICPQFTAIPRRPPGRYYHDPNEIDNLERFFDLENYPPDPQQCQSPCRPAPPPGRQGLHQDLWELEDPWYKEAEEPDLIEWKSC